jgi:chorismate synthase
MIRFTTAGESHGAALVCILEGVPAGLRLLAGDVNVDLARRQQGYGRGRRMQIEQDEVEFLAGVRAGETLGSPIAMLIRNRDWKNWQDTMDPAPREGDPALRRRAVTRPRPGHADLTGLLKYDRDDARDVLERASARETAARVAAGAVCRRLLSEFGVRLGSHLVHLGGIDAARADLLPEELNVAADASPLRTLDREAEARMIAAIDAARASGNTLGGICEVVVTGLPAGLGSHVSWDRKLDGRLAGALLSIPAVKGMEIGLGFEAARRSGAEVHDEIARAAERQATGGVRRLTNRAGGLEAGMTTGEPLLLRVAMKPIATLMRPLGTVDVASGESAAAVAERSDVTAVPAMGVIAEAMVALVLADAWMEKFGGDSLAETRRNVEGFIHQIAARIGSQRAGA